MVCTNYSTISSYFSTAGVDFNSHNLLPGLKFRWRETLNISCRMCSCKISQQEQSMLVKLQERLNGVTETVDLVT